MCSGADEKLVSKIESHFDKQMSEVGANVVWDERSSHFVSHASYHLIFFYLTPICTPVGPGWLASDNVRPLKSFKFNDSMMDIALRSHLVFKEIYLSTREALALLSDNACRHQRCVVGGLCFEILGMHRTGCKARLGYRPSVAFTHLASLCRFRLTTRRLLRAPSKRRDWRKGKAWFRLESGRQRCRPTKSLHSLERGFWYKATQRGTVSILYIVISIAS